MATSLISSPRIKALILSEAAGQRSRDNATVTQSGAAMPSGTVLALVSGKYVAYSNAASGDGGVAAAVLYQALPAATGDVKAVVFTRDAELDRNALVGLDAAGEVDLAAKGLIVRGKSGLPTVATPTLS